MIDSRWVARRCIMPAKVTTPTLTDERDADNLRVAVERTTNERCCAWQEQGKEITGGQHIVTGRIEAVFTKCATITAHSTVELWGDVYTVDGPVVRLTDRSGTLIAQQVWLVRSS